MESPTLLQQKRAGLVKASRGILDRALREGRALRSSEDVELGLRPSKEILSILELATGSLAGEPPVDLDPSPIHPAIPGPRLPTQSV